MPANVTHPERRALLLDNPDLLPPHGVRCGPTLRSGAGGSQGAVTTLRPLPASPDRCGCTCNYLATLEACDSRGSTTSARSPATPRATSTSTPACSACVSWPRPSTRTTRASTTSSTPTSAAGPG